MGSDTHETVAAAWRLLDHRNKSATVETPIESMNTSQTSCTDNILLWQWDESTGWKDPEIRTYGPLPIMPSASVLQYATECFEGIKVYRGYDDRLRLFRIQLNCERMLKSSLRVGLPGFLAADLESLIRKFAALEAEKFLPPGRKGETLYLRPTHIGTTAALGVQKPRQSLLYIIATLAPGFSTKGGGMRLLTSPASTIRAWPGGFGDAKLGANYGPTLLAHNDAIQSGFDQVLWLFGENEHVTEAGASNFFVILKSSDGQLQLITAGLSYGTILEGVTRRSILDLVRNNSSRLEAWESNSTRLPPLAVVERDCSIQEIKIAQREGRLVEAFAAGTAYFVAPVELINHRGEDIPVPCPSVQSSSYALLIKGWLSDVVFKGEDAHGWTETL